MPNLPVNQEGHHAVKLIVAMTLACRVGSFDGFREGMLQVQHLRCCQAMKRLESEGACFTIDVLGKKFPRRSAVFSR